MGTVAHGEEQPSGTGVLAAEWTEDFIKVFRIPEAEMPADLQADSPRPEGWDVWLVG